MGHLGLERALVLVTTRSPQLTYRLNQTLVVSPITGIPQLCVLGNQAHPHNWDVASCSWKYNYDINSLKQPILGHLHDADICTTIEEQTAPMNQIETTFLGWFYKHHHPDLCHNATLELAINKSLQDHIENNKEELLAFVHTYRDLHDWDGSSLPRVTVKMTRPKWTHKMAHNGPLVLLDSPTSKHSTGTPTLLSDT